MSFSGLLKLYNEVAQDGFFEYFFLTYTISIISIYKV